MQNGMTTSSWRHVLVDGVVQDLRFALRMLSKHRQSTVLTVLALALSIGANTAVFTAANAWLISPYPFPEAERLVTLEARHVTGSVGAHYRDFLDWRQRNAVFEEIAILAATSRVLTDRAETQRVTSYLTTAGALRVLAVSPILGRFFSEREDAPGTPYVALVSSSTWQRRFGGRPDIVGSVAILDGKPHTIIGVMSDGVVLPGTPRPEFWVPLRENPAAPHGGQQYYFLMARLKPGVTLQQARTNMADVARALEREDPESNQGWRVLVTSAQSFIRERAAMPVTLLFSIAGCLLLLVSANVAGVLLARASGRTREIAVRTALGAGRWRILRQVLTESVLLAVLGGALGLLVAHWLVRAAQTVVPNRGFDATLRLDAPVLLFTLAVSVLTGLLFGLSPAFRASKVDLDAALKGGMSRSDRKWSRSRFLSGLVVVEVALSMALLVGGGLLTKDFLYLLTVDTGVKTDRVLTFLLELPRRRYASDEQKAALGWHVIERLRAAPGVETAAAVGALPMSGNKTAGRFEIGSRSEETVAESPRAILNQSTPGYFRTLGIPLLRGRDFEDRDSAGAPPVAIINERLARRYFPGKDPVGERITVASGGVYTIVGVVGSVRHEGPWREVAPEISLPLAQSPGREVFFVVRSTGDPTGLVSVVRQSVREVDAGLPLERLRTMEQVVQDSLSQPRLLARVLMGFALFGLALAAIGLYGVIAYSTAQRTREIAIRVAVGATSGQVLRMVLWSGFRLAAAGLVLGMPLALGLSEGLKKFLAATGARDVVVFTGVSLILLVVALAATYIPARRATRVQPVVALRCE